MKLSHAKCAGIKQFLRVLKEYVDFWGEPLFRLQTKDPEVHSLRICNPNLDIADLRNRNLIGYGIECSAATDWNTVNPIPNCQALNAFNENNYYTAAELGWMNANIRNRVITLSAGAIAPIVGAPPAVIPPAFFDWFWVYDLNRPCYAEQRTFCRAHHRVREPRYVQPGQAGRQRMGRMIDQDYFETSNGRVEKCVSAQLTIQNIAQRADAMFNGIQEGQGCIHGGCAGVCGCFFWEGNKWKQEGGVGARSRRRWNEMQVQNRDRFAKCLSPQTAAMNLNFIPFEIPANSAAPRNRHGHHMCIIRQHYAHESPNNMDEDEIDDGHYLNEDVELEEQELKWYKNSLREKLRKRRRDQW